MFANIKQSTAKGTVSAPPSKSMAHRLLICAGLSNDTTKVQNIAFSQDILATIDCLKAIGAKCDIDNDTVTITGVNPTKLNNNIIANCRESGSTLRFFVPILLLSDCNCVLVGSEYLFNRPMSVYREICKKQNLKFNLSNGRLDICGRITAGEYVINGSISSQFISGLLFALPLLEKDSFIKIIPPIESRSYINMTISALKTFGIKIVWKDDNTLFINGNQKYRQTIVTVEGDYSNAAFYEAFNHIGGNVEILGLNNDSLQGDRIYKELFDLLGADCPIIDVSDCPDLAPILITVAALKNGATFKGTKRLEIKESNRGVVMANELAKFGADIKVFDNEIIVKKTKLHSPNEILCGHNDHRIVMSLAVISSLFGGKISDAKAINKSFPDFFDKIKLLGIKVDLDEN